MKLIEKFESDRVIRASYFPYGASLKFYDSPIPNNASDEEKAAHDLVNFFKSRTSSLKKYLARDIIISTPIEFNFTFEKIEHIKKIFNLAFNYSQTVPSNCQQNFSEIFNEIAKTAVLDIYDDNYWKSLFKEYSDGTLFRRTRWYGKIDDYSILRSLLLLIPIHQSYGNFCPTKQTGSDLDVLWWFYAVNEFIQKGPDTVPFGEWIDKEENNSLIDSYVLKSGPNEYSNTQLLIKNYMHKGFGYISRKTTKSIKSKIRLLNRDQFLELISINKEIRYPKVVSRGVYEQKLEEILNRGSSIEEELPTIKDSLMEFFEEKIDSKIFPWIIRYRIQIITPSDDKEFMFHSESKKLGKAIIDNKDKFSVEEMFSFLEGMNNSNLWIRSGKDLAWTIAAKFAETEMFPDFLRTVGGFVQELVLRAPTAKEWEKVLNPELGVMGLSTSIFSLLVVDYNGKEKGEVLHLSPNSKRMMRSRKFFKDLEKLKELLKLVDSNG